MITKRLEDLVSIYPITSDQTGVKRLLDSVGKQLKELGFKVTPLEYNGVYSIYAHPKASKHSKLLLEGHIDVVPGLNQPFRQEGDILYGRGVYDMLFGTACYLELLNEIKDQIPKLDIGILLTGDEEYGGFNGVQKFLEDGYKTEVCLIPDAGEGFGSLNIAAKGIYTLCLRVNGTAHHGSRPWEGDSATSKLIKMLSEAETIFDTSDKQNSTMTIAIINSGDAENKGPSFADCTLDIRYKDKTDLKRIKQAFEPLYKKYNVDIVDIKDGADYQLDLNNKYVKKFIKLYEKELGKKVNLTKAYGSSDARFFSSQNIPVIMLRPDGGGAHGDNEWISLSSIEKFYKLLKSTCEEI